MKKAIIIGATSGIGRGVAEQLLREGWSVGVAGRRVELLAELQTEYGAERVAVEQMDVTSPTATEALDRLLEVLDTPDLLLYASGVGRQNPELDVEVEIRSVRTNCEGMVRVVDHFLNYVRRNPQYSPRHKAHVAVITSVAGTMGMGSAPAYSATKKMQSTYLTALAQHCRMEHIPALFTDIRPGFVQTAILNPTKRYPMLMSVDEATRHILRGIEHRRRIVIFDWRFRLLVLVWRAIPRCIWERLTIIRN